MRGLTLPQQAMLLSFICRNTELCALDVVKLPTCEIMKKNGRKHRCTRVANKDWLEWLRQIKAGNIRQHEGVEDGC